MYDDNRKRQVRRILLERKIAVNGDKDIEIVCSSLNQLTIRNTSPTSLRGCHHVMIRQQASQPFGHTLVQQDLHTGLTVGKISLFTSSSNSSTCSCVTVGKSSRNSVKGSPPSM